MSTTKLSSTGRDLATYQIDADAKLGPCMNALAPRMRQFVLAKLQMGCSNAKAAELAGYQGGPNTWKAQGWKLAHDDRVQAAILEEGRKMIRDTAVMAIGVIEEIALDREVDPKDRLKAAVELLNRSGFNAVSEHKVTVEKTLSDEAVIERIKMLSERFGIDATKLLGRRPDIVDAQYEVVSEGTDAGLEDILGTEKPEPVE